MCRGGAVCSVTYSSGCYTQVDLYFFTIDYGLLLLSSGRFCYLRVVGLRREVAARWLHIHAGYIAPFSSPAAPRHWQAAL